MEQENRTRDNVVTPGDPNLASDDSSSDDSSSIDDESSVDELFDEPQKTKRRRVLDDEDEHNTEISEDIEDVSDITTVTNVTGTTGQTGGSVVTPRRIHTGNETYQEEGVDHSGNTSLLHELHSRN